MSVTTIESNRSKVPTFDGKQENYDQWEMQWNAFAQVEQISDALGDALSSDMPANDKAVIDETKEEGKKQAKAKKANAKAVA